MEPSRTNWPGGLNRRASFGSLDPEAEQVSRSLTACAHGASRLLWRAQRPILASRNSTRRLGPCAVPRDATKLRGPSAARVRAVVGAPGVGSDREPECEIATPDSRLFRSDSENELRRSVGGNSGGATPDPIPNSEVKSSSADGNVTETWRESRSPPAFFSPVGPLVGPAGEFVSCHLAHSPSRRLLRFGGVSHLNEE